MADRRILFISKGESRASTRYRALQYFPLLEQAGWTPLHIGEPKGLSRRRTLLRAAAEVDVVVVLRKPFTAPFRALLRRAARRLVFDLDDAIFLDDRGRASGLRQRRFAAMARACDLVWAGNRHLVETCREFNGRVRLVPTTLDPARYDVHPAKPADALTLVWIGSSSTRKYLEALLPTLEEAAARIPNLRLKIVADFDLPAERLATVECPWNGETEAIEIAAAHIGLAPMPDDPWTRGKCGLKVLQYMAAGLPVIASAAGVHREIIEPGRTGVLAGSPAEWIEAIAQLGADDAQRAAMGRAGRERVTAVYSREAAFATLLASLEELDAAC